VIVGITAGFIFFGNSSVRAEGTGSVVKEGQTYLLDFDTGSIGAYTRVNNSSLIYSDADGRKWIRFVDGTETLKIALSDGQLHLGLPGATIGSSIASAFSDSFDANGIPTGTFGSFEVSYDMTVRSVPSNTTTAGFQFNKKAWFDWYGVAPSHMVSVNKSAQIGISTVSEEPPLARTAAGVPGSTKRIKVAVRDSKVQVFANDGSEPVVHYDGAAPWAGGFIGLYSRPQYAIAYDNLLVNRVVPEEQREDFGLTAGDGTLTVQLPGKLPGLSGFAIRYQNVTDQAPEQLYSYAGAGNEAVILPVDNNKVYKVRLLPVYTSPRTNTATELTMFKEKLASVGAPPSVMQAVYGFDFNTRTAEVMLKAIGADSIRYTVDGSEPGPGHGVEVTGNVVVEASFTIDRTTTVRAAAISGGIVKAGIQAVYRAVPNPTVISETYGYHDGFFHEPQQVELHSDYADGFVYTTDGTDPVYDSVNGTAAHGVMAEGDSIRVGIAAGSSHVKAVPVRSNLAGSIQSKAYAYLPPNVQAAYYVDPVNGSDLAAGTEAAPFRTLAAARDAVRQVNGSMTGDIVVYLRGGLHSLDSTFALERQDSGSRSFRVVYKAYPGEEPVISGGQAVSGWTLVDSANNIYEAPALGINTRQLYVNGARATRARSAEGLMNATVNAVGHTTSMTEMAGWRNVDDIEMVYKERWTSPRFSVDRIEVAGGTAAVIMDQPGWAYGLAKGSTAPTVPWYVENAYELLDQPGEWYLDRSLDRFYYIPLPGEDMTAVEAVAPVLTELVTVKGASVDLPVHDIAFEGLTFRYATWLRPGTEMGHADVQANYVREPALPGKSFANEFVIDAAVTVASGLSVNFERCTFSGLGATGLNLLDGSQNSLVRGNRFHDISGSGLQIGEVDMNDINNRNPSDPKYLLKNIRVENNYFHHVAVEYMAGVGVSAAYPDSLQIVHNEFAYMPYSAIHIGWAWENFPANATKNNLIEANYIHDVVQTLHDGGAFYVVGRSSGPDALSYVRHNFIENIKNYHGALYFDQGSSDWRSEENVVKNVQKLIVGSGTATNTTASGNITDTLGVSLPASALQNTVYVTDGIWPQDAVAWIAGAGVQAPYLDILPAERPSTVAVPEEYLLYDDFEQYVIGGNMTEWNKVQTGGPIAVVGEPANQYMELKSLGSGGAIVSYNYFKGSYGLLTFQYKIKASSSQGFRLAPYLQSANADIAISLAMMDGNFVNNKGAAGVAVIQPYEVNRWYDIRIVADTWTRKLDMYIDGVKKLNQESFRMEKSELDQIRFGNEATVAGELAIDDVRVYRGVRGVTELAVSRTTEAGDEVIAISAPYASYAAHLKLDIGSEVFDVKEVALSAEALAQGAESPVYSLDGDGLLDIILNLPREGTLVNGSMELVRVVLTPRQGSSGGEEVKVLSQSAVYRMNGDIYRTAEDIEAIDE
jgi:hypothetical protein